MLVLLVRRYMYTMFNSQAPGARQLTVFYTQDLQFTSLNVSRADYTVGITSAGLSCFECACGDWLARGVRMWLAQSWPVVRRNTGKSHIAGFVLSRHSAMTRGAWPSGAPGWTCAR